MILRCDSSGWRSKNLGRCYPRRRPAWGPRLLLGLGFTQTDVTIWKSQSGNEISLFESTSLWQYLSNKMSKWIELIHCLPLIPVVLSAVLFSKPSLAREQGAELEEEQSERDLGLQHGMSVLPYTAWHDATMPTLVWDVWNQYNFINVLTSYC